MSKIRTVLDRNERILRRLKALSLVRTWRVIIPGTWPFNPSPSRILRILTLLTYASLSPALHTLVIYRALRYMALLTGPSRYPSCLQATILSTYSIHFCHSSSPSGLIVVGHDDEYALYQSVIRFLQRKRLRRLYLGSCPGSILPDLQNLRVLGDLISNLHQQNVGIGI